MNWIRGYVWTIFAHFPSSLRLSGVNVFSNWPSNKHVRDKNRLSAETLGYAISKNTIPIEIGPLFLAPSLVSRKLSVDFFLKYVPFYVSKLNVLGGHAVKTFCRILSRNSQATSKWYQCPRSDKKNHFAISKGSFDTLNWIQVYFLTILAHFHQKFRNIRITCFFELTEQ